MMFGISKQIRERGEYRLGPYGSFRHRFALTRWNWSINLCKFEDHWAIHFFCLWITLWSTDNPPAEMMDSWGFQYDHEMAYIRLTWGSRGKFLYMPWAWDHCLTEIMLADNTFVPYEVYKLRSIERSPEPADLYRQTFPYHYLLKNGDIQYRQATITVERRTWCWRAWPFSSFRWPRKTITSIHVEFNNEVGERSGSWKGGTIGCGWDLLPGESPEQCLRRMEAERKFN